MIYKGKYLTEINFPIGGIGTGSIGLMGNGSLQDWEIFNRPAKGSVNGYSFFAVKAKYPDGKSIVKVLQGDWNKDLSGRYTGGTSAGFGQGADYYNLCGLPHFRKVTFDGRFPIARLTFEDKDFPAKVIMTAFNPFIPLDADASSIPAAFFDIKFISRVDGVIFTALLTVSNPFKVSKNEKSQKEYTAVTMRHAGVPSTNTEYGDLTVAVDRRDGICQEYWYRGWWPQDRITAFWRELNDGELTDRHYDDVGSGDVCTVGASNTLNKGKAASARFVIAWSIPNCRNYWEPFKDKDGNDVVWRNYYATLFGDSLESAIYSLKNWKALYKRTLKFHHILHGSSLDSAVTDAVSSTLSVLKSSTVLRLEDGTLYGWEGVNETVGSCQGTCTHVWSYTYALCFLFPELERSLRDTEFRYDTDKDGRMYFRTALPLGRGVVDEPPCVDGQMATVIKIYRDWKLTGNSKWLRDNWGNVKKILEYAWNDKNFYEWDRDRDGVLDGRQHHTLDMELFGPSSWLESMYLCALKAAAEMAEFIGEPETAREYTRLFENGFKWTKENLFNGEYFYHKVDLARKEYTEHFNCPNYWNGEKNQLKYQIGDGCEIDQMLGQFHANLCGLGDVLDKKQRRTALQSIMRYNFKESIREVANMWRVFAINDESGTVICHYPKNKEKPIIPISYCEECMTGFEYALAVLLISEGFIDDGLKVVRAVRDRYDGEKRNPWNEMECGSNYARPMASFGLLQAFSGFEYDLTKGYIGFAPVTAGDFNCFWAVGTGWGEVKRSDTGYVITLAEGYIVLESISLDRRISEICIDGKKIDFTQNGNRISFDKIRVTRDMIFK